MRVKKELQNTKRILVFNPSFIGDAILTTPLITALMRLLPDATVDFCVRPESAPMFIDMGFNTIAYDKHNTQKGLLEMLRFANSLKGYDIGFFLHKSLRSTAIMYFANAKYSVGFNEGAMSMLYDARVHRNMNLHEVERNLELLHCICEDYSLQEAKTLAGKPVTHLDKSYAANLRAYMQTVTGGKKVIGINAGSTWHTKMWSVQYFAKLADMLYDAGFTLLILGGPGDKLATDALKAAIGFEYFDFAAKVPFEQIPAVISSLDVLVTNDSAPLHIAVSQNVPAVAIFGPTVKELGFFPYDEQSIVCENAGLYCRPCGLHGGKRCPEKHFRCMLEVTPDMVYQALMRVLA